VHRRLQGLSLASLAAWGSSCANRRERAPNGATAGGIETRRAFAEGREDFRRFEMKMMIPLAVAGALAAIAPPVHAQYNAPYDPSRPYAAPERLDRPYDRRDEDRGREDRARVIDSRPIYGEAGTHEECWNDNSHAYERNRGVGTALGAIAGGVIGHQIGSGSGNTAATIAGAVGGGVVGNHIARRGEANGRNCRTVRDDNDNSRDLLGYDVRYEYRGHEYETRLDRDPGRWLVVGRDTRPDGTPFDVASADYDRDHGYRR
jgi:uncharacterized protein YcfJ